jgi:cytochrome P450
MMIFARRTRTFTPDHLTAPATYADPYPVYHQLRGQSPVRYIGVRANPRRGINAPIWTWGLLKYEHVYDALRDHEAFSSTNPLDGRFSPRIVLIRDDPPRHTRFRRLVNKAFTLKRVKALEPWIASVVNALLDEMGQETVDVVKSFCVPLPLKVIGRLLGIPGEDYATFKRWSEALLTTVSTEAKERPRNVHEMVTYLGQMAVARRAHGAEDVITALVDAQIEGESLQDWEILGFCILLLVAGSETTTSLLGNMLNAVVERPELWQRLRVDRSLVECVIDETLRYESPLQRLFRTATRDVELSGAKIAKGDRVTIFYGAANRDPQAFPNPDEFRLDRDLRNHVAFGTGIHYCLGAPLARAEAEITLNAFLDRFPVIRRGEIPAVRQKASSIVLGFSQLPLVVQSR